MGAGKRRATAPIPSWYRLALMILDDQCPPDGAFYLCRMACQGECDDVCADCWRRYLYHAASGGTVAHFQPVRAVFGVGNPLCARFRSGRALLMALQAGLIPR